MDPANLTENVPSGVEKRTLKGLYGRVKQVEGRVDAAYKGLNQAMATLVAQAVSTLSLAFNNEISKLQSEIDNLKGRVGSLELDGIGDLEPAKETPDSGVQPA